MIYWILIMALLGGFVSLGIFYQPVIMTTSDPSGFARGLIIGPTRALLGILLLTLGLRFIDFVTPGDWLEGIADDPHSSAIVVGVILYIVGQCYLG